jgi:hypothetical protein
MQPNPLNAEAQKTLSFAEEVFKKQLLNAYLKQHSLDSD